MFSLYVGTQYFILGHILCSLLLLFFSFFCLHKDVLSSYHEIVLNIFPVLLFFLVDTNKVFKIQMNFSTTNLAYYFIHLFHKCFVKMLGLGIQWALSQVQGLFLTELIDQWDVSLQQALDSSVMCSGSEQKLWEHVSGSSCSGIRREFPE